MLRGQPSRRAFLRGGLAAAAGSCWACAPRPAGRDHGPFDVCVIGSGFAGALLAERLGGAGLATVVVEAGTAERRTDRAFDYRSSGPIDYPVEQSRVIGIGGTSDHWTGMVNRLRPTDFRLRSQFGLDVDWPIGYDDLAPYYCEAERALAVTGHAPLAGAEPPRDCVYPHTFRAPYRGPQLRLGGTDLRFFPVPRSRVGGRGGPVRLAREQIPRLLALPGVALLPGLRVERLVPRDGRAIDHARGRTLDGDASRIHARVFVVAAGVVESARLLLVSRSPAFPDGPGNGHDLVGRHFVEHPTFVWSVPRRPGLDVPAGFHRTYDLNDRFRAEGLNACHLQIEAGDGERVVWKLQPELEPRPDNRVTLVDDPPLPDVHFGYSERDRRTIEAARRLVEPQLRELAPDPTAIRSAERWRCHPAGTCRMGQGPQDGVVDRDLRVFGLDNLYVSGAAVFPTSGTSNPTLTVVALTLRLGDYLVDRAGRAGSAGAGATTGRPATSSG